MTGHHHQTPPGSRLLLLLRHGEVTSHRGDVPVTEAGLEYAYDTGREIGRHHRKILTLNGETKRTRQTAVAFAEGARMAGAEVIGPDTAHAMRNPDIYVAGVRVSMVSQPDALAAQVPGLSTEQAAQVPFFRAFFAAADSIQYWLQCEEPPGETSKMVAARILAFAISLVDAETTPTLIVGITHSPILRAISIACLNHDPGEPNWLAGVRAEIDTARNVRWDSVVDPLQQPFPLNLESSS